MSAAVDEIKQRLDIVDVVAGYLRLEKAGQSFKALCPFHQEKSPSFFVFPQRQGWHCFGCGANGDLFSFIMKKEGLSFGEALELLAQRAGVPLTARRGKAAQDERTESLYRINEAAAQHYHHLLLNSAVAQAARDYIGQRDIARETSERFQLGYSPDSWEELKQHLMGKGYKESELVVAGLLIAKEGRTYDRFRNRLMFPISDIRGRISGFGARALDNSSPKYLNSPQTPVFDKSGVLYGVDRAKDAIREQKAAIIVEGYMDVITAHQHGFRNIVASMGTAITEKQIGLLKGLARSIVLALDPDAAGDAATLRGIEACRKALEHKVKQMPDWLGATSKLDAEVRIISLPRGKDPDDVIRENPEAWQSLVKESSPLLDHLFLAVTAKLDLSKPREKSAAAAELLPLIQEMEDDIERELYLGKLARLLAVSERTLVGMAAQLHRPARKKAGGQVAEPTQLPTGEPLEEYCLCLLLQYPELRDKTRSLLPDHFERSENRELFLAWQDKPQDLSERLEADLQEHLYSLANRTLPPVSREQIEPALADCLRRLEEKRLRRLKEYEELLLAESESQGNMQELAEFAFALWKAGGVPSEDWDETSVRLAEQRLRDEQIGAKLGEAIKKTGSKRQTRAFTKGRRDESRDSGKSA